jgi:hypothetical protein
MADEKGTPDLRLELADLGRHRRLGEIQTPGRAGNLAGLGHHPESLQPAGVKFGKGLGIHHQK